MKPQNNENLKTFIVNLKGYSKDELIETLNNIVEALPRYKNNKGTYILFICNTVSSTNCLKVIINDNLNHEYVALIARDYGYSGSINMLNKFRYDVLKNIASKLKRRIKYLNSKELKTI